MKKIHYTLVLLLALCSAPASAAEVRIGVEISEYPEMVLVPGYPVYYAPEVSANYFFYEGDFWMYQDDNWYRSPWYNGPWERVDPEDVPDILLQIPVRYYELPPAYFFTWWYDDPPHWGERWGHDWERHRHGWNKRDHRRHDKPAPLPDYQRQYSGDRYPGQVEQQHELHRDHYRYRARDPFVLQHRQIPPPQGAPALQNRDRVPEAGGPIPRNIQRTNPVPQGNLEAQRIPQRERVKEPGVTVVSPQPARTEAQPRRQEARPETVHREERQPRAERTETRRQERDAEPETNRSEERGRNRER